MYIRIINSVYDNRVLEGLLNAWIENLRKSISFVNLARFGRNVNKRLNDLNDYLNYIYLATLAVY